MSFLSALRTSRDFLAGFRFLGAFLGMVGIFIIKLPG